MISLWKPGYYDDFRCLAGACPDSCCKDWSVEVDPRSAAFYQGLSGPLGDDLRRALEDDGVTMRLVDGRCPMWRGDGLCRIQADLGEEALCQVCRQFPRLRHDYGSFVELGLELSCPEAARLILSTPQGPMVVQSLPGDEAPDWDPALMALLLRFREHLHAALANPTVDPGALLAAMLLYGYDVDAALSFPEDCPEEFSVEDYLAAAKSIPGEGSMEAIFAFFRGLEILTPRWQAVLDAGPKDMGWNREYFPLIRYFVDRYCLQAVSDGDLAGRMKFIALSCLMIRSAGLPLPAAAQLYAKEIENDPDNVDALLDGAFTAPALSDRAVLSLLLRNL